MKKITGLLILLVSRYLRAYPLILVGILDKGSNASIKVGITTPRNTKTLTNKTCSNRISLIGKDATLYRDNHTIQVSDRRVHYQHRIYLKFMRGGRFKPNIVFTV